MAWATAEFIRRPPNRASRLALYVVLVSVAVGVVYASVTRIAISVDAPGVIATERPSIPVKVAVSIRVSRLLVRDNQIVKKGEVLVVSEEQLSSEDSSKIDAAIGEASALVSQSRRATCAGCETRLRALSEQGFSLSRGSALSDTFTPVRDLLRELADALGQRERLPSLTASARRQLELSNAKIKEIEQRGAEALLGTQLEALTNEAVAARNTIAEREQTVASALSSTANRLEVRLDALRTALALFRGQQDVLAPADGTVTNLKISAEGQLVAAGSTVLDLIPTDTSLVAELAIANRDIALVKVAMPVLLKLDALPERQYGAARGEVLVVPVSVVAQDGPPAPPSYRVIVRLSDQRLTSGNTTVPLKLGMTLRGSIVTHYQSLLDMAMKKLVGLTELGG